MHLLQTYVRSALETILDGVINMHKTHLGNIQLLERKTGFLHIAAQKGFTPDFLEHFKIVKVDDDSACGRALRLKQTILITDTHKDELFKPHRKISDNAGFRSVQSTPLVYEDKVLGILSTHFSEPRQFSNREMTDLKKYISIATASLMELAYQHKVKI